MFHLQDSVSCYGTSSSHILAGEKDDCFWSFWCGFDSMVVELRDLDPGVDCNGSLVICLELRNLQLLYRYYAQSFHLWNPF